ncbi:hypothetical protein DHX103_11220 [Planococcus sp. X10-3]|uniref:hypothetical protein n=1 Tax=Planococcus sp. X10-3 TaxID=3061240 RepID=UPI003BAEB440
MKGTNKKRPASVKFLIFLHLFLAAGALAGGFGMIFSPAIEDNSLGIPVSYLENDLFSNLLIPGLLLFTVLGVFPLVIAYFLFSKKPFKLGQALNVFRDKYWSWGFSLYVGFAVIIWITVQVYLLQMVVGFHLFYMAYGLLLLIATLWPNVQRHYMTPL